jgi:hypothetical protein
VEEFYRRPGRGFHHWHHRLFSCRDTESPRKPALPGLSPEKEALQGGAALAGDREFHFSYLTIAVYFISE